MAAPVPSSALSSQRTKEAEVHFLEPIRSNSTSSSNATPYPFPPASGDDPSKSQFRPRSLSHHLSSQNPPSRKWLLTQAKFWRFMMEIAIHLHDLAPPKPPQPSFIRKISCSPSSSSSSPLGKHRASSDSISLVFYTPRDYTARVKAGHRFPVVVNFHGGGFVLGDPTDDRYWVRVVMEEVDAVVVSVGYRLAPEHPFPTAVDDGVEALLYLSAHAESLGLDTNRVALSGFSAGANLCFTVPLRLQYTTRAKITSDTNNTTTTTTTTDNTNNHANKNNNDPINSASTTSSTDEISRWQSTERLLSAYTGLHIVSIVAWYPLLDWTLSRNEKRRHSVRPSKTLPKFFTELFDHSYLPPPREDHISPYASPALAPSDMLTHGIPQDVQIFLCEWDMLLREGKRFSARLTQLGKNVRETLIPNVPHGWDKSPSPWRNQMATDALYSKACAGLVKSFA